MTCCHLSVLFSWQEAKEKFQQLQKVIAILGDEEKRAIYDQTGCIDDAVSVSVYDRISIAFLLHFLWQLFLVKGWKMLKSLNVWDVESQH